MKNIPIVIQTLKEEIKKYKKPIVTKISNIRKDPFLVLISCLLSLRTKDETTANASYKLFKFAKTPKAMLKLSTDNIEKTIYPVGFYRTKARRIKEICKTLIKEYNGKVPDNIDELLKLKGVGRKTANIVLVFGFDKKYHLPIDVHCHRIPNRLGWIKTKTPEETEKALERVLPREYWFDFNDTFVTFGQNICKPVSPFCSKCVISRYCKKVGVDKRR